MLQAGMEKFVEISKPKFEEKIINLVENLSRKVHKLSITSSWQSQQTNPPLMSIPSSGFSHTMKETYGKMKEWKNVKNIIELVNSIDCLSLYPALLGGEDFIEDSGAILRCETCFSLYKDKATKLTPAKAAQALSAQCLSICTGKYLSPDTMVEMTAGYGENWRKLKSRILQHMVCANDGQTHFKALTLKSEDERLKRKYYEAAENLLKSALTAVKSKSAALHFENLVAFAYSVGGQVGQCGHSRKLFGDYLKCLLAVINKEVKKKLTACLPATNLPPHYYMTVDKATVNKRLNQAVIICPILEGKRVPIAVGAPEVYKAQDDGSVRGGTLSDAGNQAIRLVERKYGAEVLESLIGNCSIIFVVSFTHNRSFCSCYFLLQLCNVVTLFIQHCIYVFICCRCFSRRRLSSKRFWTSV